MAHSFLCVSDKVYYRDGEENVNMERKDRTKSCNSSACNCALAAQLAANELEQLGSAFLPQATLKWADSVTVKPVG